MSDLRPVEGNKARTSFPWGVGCKNGGRNRRYREGDASRRRAHVEFSDQKKKGKHKKRFTERQFKGGQGQGRGVFFSGRGGDLKNNSGRGGDSKKKTGRESRGVKRVFLNIFFTCYHKLSSFNKGL